MRRRTAVLAVPFAALALAAAPARAQEAPADPAPAPTPAPAAGALEIHFVSGVFGLRGSLGSVAGATWSVRGTVRPYVAGQKVVVRFYRNGRKVKAVSAKVASATVDGQEVGRFYVPFRAPRSGRMTVRASHRATAEQKSFTARPRRVRLLDGRIRAGERGPVVRLLQERLAALAFAVPRSGRYDDGTQRAVIAYRKTNGLPRTTEVGAKVLDRLVRGVGAFRVRYPDHGKHVEADLSRQVLALVLPGGRVHRVYHTSSGAPGTPTVTGSYRFYSKTPGTNAKGMVHSAYFIRGYAIHGYASVPTHPASHGCLRVPIPNARSIFDWVAIGDGIDVYH